MVGKRSDEGDLFPRGNALNSTPRIKKRDGQVLFGPDSKRPRQSRSSEIEPAPNDSVLQFGATLNLSKLTQGMSVLGCVVKANQRIVEFVLSSGIRATCVDDTLLEDELSSLISAPNFKKTSEMDVDTANRNAPDDGDSSDESMSDGESSSDEDAQTHVQPVWQVVSVGSVFPLTIVDVDKSRSEKVNVSVSLKPHLVNVGLNPVHLLKKNFLAFAAVLSVEDHGYVLSFGSNIPHTAFLPYELCHEHSEEKRLCPGTPVQVVTVSDSSLKTKKSKASVSTVVRVSARASDVFSKAIDILQSPTIQDLRAGMALRARVLREGPGGLSLLFMGVFNISVDAMHVPHNDDGSRSLPVNSQVTLRLLCVDSASKMIIGSLLPSLVKEQRLPIVPAAWKIGTLLKPVVVENIKPHYGLILRCSENPSVNVTEGSTGQPLTLRGDEPYVNEQKEATSVSLFAHSSKITDTKKIDLGEKFRPGSVIKEGARIISISRMDGIANVDLRPSVLSRRALSIDEVEPGCIYDCKVLNHTTFGSISVAVDGDPRLVGLIRSAHISDVPISIKKWSQHKPLQIGATLKCLVLSVDAGRGKIYLSARKSLVSPKYPTLISLEDVAEQVKKSKDGEHSSKKLLFTGSVLRVTEKCNLLVGFCNKLSGLVFQGDMCLDMSNRSFSYSKGEIEKIYPPGQTIAVRVIDVDLPAEKLYLSLDLQTSGRNNTSPVHQLGSIIDIKVIGADRSSRHFIALASRRAGGHSQKNTGDQLKGTQNNNIQIALKSVEYDEKLKCHLPYGHLSDFSAMSERLAMALEERLNGSKRNSKSKEFILSSAMVFCHRDGTPVVTLKDSLKSASLSGHFPSTFEEVNQLVQRCNGESLILRGYVKALLPLGVIVGLKGNQVGFVRKAKVADFFIADVARALRIDQSIVVKLDSLDEEKSRINLSARQSDVGIENIQRDAGLFSSSLKQWSQFMGTSVLEAEFPIGSVTKATLHSELAYGVQYRLGTNESATGVVFDIDNDDREVIVGKPKGGVTKESGRSKGNHVEALSAVGAIHDVRVLDIDLISGVVDLSREKDLIEGKHQAEFLVPEKSYEGRVLLVKNTHIILVVRKTKTRTVIACSPPPSLTESLVIRPGAVVLCKAFKRDPESSRNVVSIDWETFRGKSNARVGLEKRREATLSSEAVSILRKTASEDPSGVKGMVLTGRVTRSFGHFSYLAFGLGAVGHLHVLNVDTLSAEEAEAAPLGRLSDNVRSRFSLPEVESYIPQCFVVSVRKSAGIGDGNPLVVEVALKKERCEPTKLVVGQRVVGIVRRLSSCLSSNRSNVSQTRTLISLGPSLTASCSNVDCLESDKYINIGIDDAVMCLVTDVSEESEGRVRVSLTDNGINNNTFFSGIVDSVTPGRGIRVKIPWLARDSDAKMNSWGTVDVSDMGVDFDEVSELTKSLKAGSIVRVRKVVTTDNKENREQSRIYLTMRNESNGVVDPTVSPDNVSKLRVGTPLRGFVRTVGKFGCFVTIGRGVVAHVRMGDLSDGYVENPETEFPVGALVSGTVTEVNKVGDVTRVRLTFRKRRRANLQNDEVSKSDLEEGQILVCTVKRVGKYGAVLLVKPGVTGLLHTSEADQGRVIERPFEEWVVNQQLKCVVIKAEEGKVMLGTKRCYFEAAGVDEEDVDEILDQNERWKSERSSEFQQDTGFVESLEPDDAEIVDVDEIASDDASNAAMLETSALNSNGMEEDDDEDEGDEVDADAEDNTRPAVAPLIVPQGFDFGEDGDDVTRSHDSAKVMKGDEDTDGAKDEATRGRSSHDKREKKKTKQAEELEIRLREEALARGDDIADTAEDYERMVMGEPNSSAIWIRYMAFCVELSQMEKARAVAERALETIALEKEIDRTNVWVAYINMEAQFGNTLGLNERTGGKAGDKAERESGERSRILREAAVLRVFDRACERVTDVENLHLTVASALRKSSPILADEILKRACRKFKSSENVWLAIGQARFSEGDLKLGRQCLEKGLLAVDKAKHTDLITKFAQFEYKMGSPERGRTVFESLVGNLKKRIDVWSIYLDMEVGLCKKSNGDTEDVARTRQVFARFAALDRSSKKMKFAFKKWLEFEKMFGEKSDQKKVKQLAREYVERNVSAK